MLDAVNNHRKQRGRPFKLGVSGNPHGRPKGSRNLRTRTLLEAAQNGGEMPLDYFLRVMRDPSVSAKRRDEMAKAAAPFLHARLASIEHSGSQDKPPITGIEVVFVTPKPRRSKGAALLFTDQFAPTLRHILSARSNGGRQDALNIYLADVALGQHGDERKL